MLIKINGEDVDIPEGSTIKDAIEISNALSLNWKFLKNQNL